MNMPTAQQSRRHDEEDKQRRDRLSDVIRQHVLQTLGEPGGIYRVQIRPLWESHYRVNVIVGEDAGAAKIANSYFLEADGAGNIIQSTPKMTRQY
jgi:hypothetical protein